MTTDDRISCIAWQAFTVGRMIEYGALGTMSAHARTWIDALLIYACAGLGAIGVDHALGSALDIWIAKVFGQTFTCCGAVTFLA